MSLSKRARMDRNISIFFLGVVKIAPCLPAGRLPGAKTGAEDAKRIIRIEDEFN